MKQFTQWLTEMDQPGVMPPVNGGITPVLPPDVAAELSTIAQKLNNLLKKIGVNKNDAPTPKAEKGLGDISKGDSGLGNAIPGPPPNFQT